MRNSTLGLIIAALLIAVAAFFTWQHVRQLDDRLGALGEQVASLGEQVVAAEERATEAEERAIEAEAQADQARQESTTATQLAESAAAKGLQSAEQARAAETARQVAEERERQAARARQKAEQLARQEAEARAQEEARRAAAEQERAEAYRQADAARDEAYEARVETERIRERLEEQLDRLQGALGRIAQTRRTALGLVMTLDSDQIEFDFNKATLRPKNRELLSRIAGVLLTFENYAVQVFGHTDDVGTVDYNQKLSEQRAGAVRDYLEEAGIDSAALSTLGLGKSSPLVEGSDPAARQRNRRVELAIVFSEGEYEPTEPEE